jgi:cobalamin transport system ATP-binding protein
MSGTQIIRAEGLAVGYRRRGKSYPVLTGIDLGAAAGELICLLGPNGIGKSTLLRTLAGLQRPLTGIVRINQTDLARLTAFDRARLVGVVLPERISVGALTARQMVSLGRYAHCGWNGRLTERDHVIVARSIEAVGAGHLADRDCRELSDGERQKLNLARVLAQEAPLIILDEPTAFLDIAARAELMALLRRLTRDSGVTVIASTHDLDLAIRNADSAWLLAPDRRLSCGAPEDLLARGLLQDAFSSARVTFDPDSFAFRSAEPNRRTAFVAGSAGGARLAAIALEREGYRLVDIEAEADIAVEIADDSGRWRARVRDGVDLAGTSFGALAAFARRTADGPRPTPPLAVKADHQSRG